MDLDKMSEKAENLVDYLYDLLTNEDDAAKFAANPTEQLEIRDLGDITEDDLDQAFARAMDRLPDETAAKLAPTLDNPAAGSGAAPMQSSAPMAKAASAPAAAPAPRLVQQAPPPQVQVVERVVQAPPQVKVVERIVERVNTVHEQPIVNQTVINKAGDTIVDNSVNVNIDGDVKNADIVIAPNNVTATQGGVAAGGDIDDSAVNTGKLEGVQNAGDGTVDAEDAVIGDKNTVIEDSEVGALAQGGDAQNTDIDGKNVLVGDGELNNAEVDGEGQAVAGKGNDVADDTAVDIEDVDGPVNVAAGDDNDQGAAEADVTAIDQSVTDNSVETTDIEETVQVETTVEDNDGFTSDDNSSFELTQEETDIFAQVDDSEDTDIDFR
jgi:hypothetical protein